MQSTELSGSERIASMQSPSRIWPSGRLSLGAMTGAFTRALIRPMAEVLAALGSDRAWLVHGSDGTDELTITGVSWVAALEPDGTIRETELHPEDAGLPVHPFESILGGTPEENGRAFAALLEGAPGAYRDAVLLNAAAALVIADAAPDLRSGVDMARASIDSGAARDKVQANEDLIMSPCKAPTSTLTIETGYSPEPLSKAKSRFRKKRK